MRTANTWNALLVRGSQFIAEPLVSPEANDSAVGSFFRVNSRELLFVIGSSSWRSRTTLPPTPAASYGPT